MRVLFLLILLQACTVEVPVPQPVITIECVDVFFPGGSVSTSCLDAGKDAKK